LPIRSIGSRPKKKEKKRKKKDGRVSNVAEKHTSKWGLELGQAKALCTSYYGREEEKN
jgi:hypothetical protein